MLSKKHIDSCSCYHAVYMTAKFINGHYAQTPKCTALLLPARGSKCCQ